MTETELHVSATFTFFGNVLYQVSIVFPERKCQVMFPSYLSQDVSAVVRFCYISAADFNILVKSLQRKQTDHGFVHGFYYLDEIETL